MMLFVITIDFFGMKKRYTFYFQKETFGTGFKAFFGKL